MSSGASSEVVLRKWRTSDVQQLAVLADNRNIARFMTDAFPSPYTTEHAARFIEQALSHVPVRVFAIDFRGALAGGIGLHPQSDVSRKNAELGYWVGENFWGKGIATAAVSMFVEWGFQHLDITRIFARPFGDNLASQKVLRKCGFELEAVIKNGFYKNERFTDELLFAVRK